MRILFMFALTVLVITSEAKALPNYLDAAPIDPETVWAELRGEGVAIDGGAWRPTTTGDDSDGWVMLAPDQPSPAGGTVTLTVGARTVEGTPVDPVSEEFQVTADEPSDHSAPPLELVEEPNVRTLPPILATLSGPYRLAPQEVFVEPVTVQIPVPNGSKSEDLEVYYYSEARAHRAWYLGENVVGWMVPDSRRVVQDGDQAFIEIQVNHGGVLQLGKALRIPRVMGIGTIGRRG